MRRNNEGEEKRDDLGVRSGSQSGGAVHDRLDDDRPECRLPHVSTISYT